MNVSKTIQIPDLPEDVHRTLKERAAAEGLTLSDYAIQELAKLEREKSVLDALTRASRGA